MPQLSWLVDKPSAEDARRIRAERRRPLIRRLLVFLAVLFVGVFTAYHPNLIWLWALEIVAAFFVMMDLLRRMWPDGSRFLVVTIAAVASIVVAVFEAQTWKGVNITCYGAYVRAHRAEGEHGTRYEFIVDGVMYEGEARLEYWSGDGTVLVHYARLDPNLNRGEW